MKYRSVAIAVLSTTLGIAVVHATDARSAFRFAPPPAAKVVVPADSLPAQIAEVLTTREGPVVLLQPEGTDQYLPIWISQDQAHAIDRARTGVDMPRPMTHDLFASVLGELETRIAHVRVDRLRADGVYVGTVTVVRQHEVMDIDARPSDALALAVRTGARIYIDESLRAQLIRASVD